MTIQISVIIWTVICFIVLYLILNNILFKPLLAVMDKRREKAEKAEAEKKRAEEELEKKRLLEAAEKEALKERRWEEAKAEAETIRSEGKRLLEEAKKDRVEKVARHRAESETGFAEDMKAAENDVGRIADVFLDKFGTR